MLLIDLYGCSEYPIYVPTQDSYHPERTGTCNEAEQCHVTMLSLTVQGRQCLAARDRNLGVEEGVSS
eukprot:959761-Rhodomonas_salina.3